MIVIRSFVRSTETLAREHEPGFWDEVAVLRIVGIGERPWEEIVRRAGLDDDAVASALDAMVEGGMLSVRSVDEGTAAFSLTQRGRARLLEVNHAFGERGVR
jgi:predicted transcriptional regulator